MLEISERAKKIAEILDNKKAQDIVVLKVADMTIISDYFVVASAPNTLSLIHISRSAGGRTGQAVRGPGRKAAGSDACRNRSATRGCVYCKRSQMPSAEQS